MRLEVYSSNSPGMEKYIWKINGYNKKGEDGKMLESTTILVNAKDEKEAVAKASKLVKKNMYWVLEVAEHCEDCHN
jgi:hypothetical protein